MKSTQSCSARVKCETGDTVTKEVSKQERMQDSHVKGDAEWISFMN